MIKQRLFVELPVEVIQTDRSGSYSYSISQIDTIVKYIHNQSEHRKTKTFIEEYIGFLEEFEVPFDERYIFKPVEY